MTLRVILALAVLGASACRKPAPVEAPITPAPATPEPTPEPVVVKATPTPTPRPVATPTPTPPPTPPPLDLATLTSTPNIWPPQVALIQPVALPIIIGGRVAGEVTVPAGSALRLVRVAGPQLEVEYQSGRHIVASAATDVLQRATEISRNPPATPAPAPATPQPSASVAMSAPAPAAAEPIDLDLTTKEAQQRLVADVVRIRKSGDREPNRERVEVRVRLTNTDTRKTAKKLKGEIYLFSESSEDRASVKVLAVEGFECKLEPRATHEMTTKEATTDNGYKYDGWFLRVRDNSGYDVLLKSNSPTLVKNAGRIKNLAAGKTYDRATFKEKEMSR